jgi:hypothetical protein
LLKLSGKVAVPGASPRRLPADFGAPAAPSPHAIEASAHAPIIHRFHANTFTETKTEQPMFKLSKLALPAALLILTGLLAQPALAGIVIVNDGTYGDTAFTADCRDGTADPSAGNNACEYGVIETKPRRSGSGGNSSMYIRPANFNNILGIQYFE